MVSQEEQCSVGKAKCKTDQSFVYAF